VLAERNNSIARTGRNAGLCQSVCGDFVILPASRKQSQLGSHTLLRTVLPQL